MRLIKMIEGIVFDTREPPINHRILKELEKIMATLDDLKAAEAAESAAIQGLIAYVQTVPSLVAAAVTAAQANDQATIDALVSQVQADTAALTAATPAPPAPPAETPPAS